MCPPVPAATRLSVWAHPACSCSPYLPMNTFFNTHVLPSILRCPTCFAAAGLPFHLSFSSNLTPYSTSSKTNKMPAQLHARGWSVVCATPCPACASTPCPACASTPLARSACQATFCLPSCCNTHEASRCHPPWQFLSCSNLSASPRLCHQSPTLVLRGPLPASVCALPKGSVSHNPPRFYSPHPPSLQHCASAPAPPAFVPAPARSSGALGLPSQRAGAAGASSSGEAHLLSVPVPSPWLIRCPVCTMPSRSTLHTQPPSQPASSLLLFR